MLGHLRMNVDKAIDALITVASAVFGDESQNMAIPETNSKHLKEAIEEMLQTREIPVSSKMYERDRPQTRCKVYVYSSYTFHFHKLWQRGFWVIAKRKIAHRQRVGGAQRAQKPSRRFMKE